MLTNTQPIIDSILATPPPRFINATVQAQLKQALIDDLGISSGQADTIVAALIVILDSLPRNSALPLQASDLIASIKWTQSPELSNPGIAIKVDQFGGPHILADDFLCNATGPLVEITIWGSFKGDVTGPLNFDLAVHADIPEIPAATPPATTVPPVFSRPAESPLWTGDFPSGSYTMVLVNTDSDWWWDPAAQLDASNPSLATGTGADYKFTFTSDPNDAFLQTGTPSEPMIYWLSVTAYITSSSVEFGWKTRLVSEGTFNDNAVWAPSSTPPISSAWGEMTYPVGHPLSGAPLDMAFALTTLAAPTTTGPPV